MRHVPIDFEVHEIGSHRVMQQSRYAHVKSRHRQISTFRKSSSMPHVQHSQRWPNVLVTSLLQTILRFMLDMSNTRPWFGGATFSSVGAHTRTTDRRPCSRTPTGGRGRLLRRHLGRGWLNFRDGFQYSVSVASRDAEESNTRNRWFGGISSC